MSTSFQERAALQRRQVHHQQLLDSQRFGASHGGTRQSYDSGAGGGFFALIALVFVLIFLLYVAMAALLSAVAAVPVVLALTMLARAMPYHVEIGYARTYAAAFIGILSYLAITLVIAYCAGFVSQSGSHPGFLNQLAGAIVELRHLAATSASSFTTGEIAVAGFFGFTAERVHSIPVLVAALAALHGPGLVVCGAVLSKRIGESYMGFCGFVIACAVSLATVPASLAAAIWAAAILYKRFHSI